MLGQINAPHDRPGTKNTTGWQKQVAEWADSTALVQQRACVVPELCLKLLADGCQLVSTTLQHQRRTCLELDV